jgi:hypothetical protein
MNTFLPKERWDYLHHIANISSKLDGHMAELGVASGQVCIELAKTHKHKKIYAFDTFTGFSGLTEEYFEASPKYNAKFYKDRFGHEHEWDRAWGKNFPWEDILSELKMYENIEIRQGLFPETPVGLENERYCFVHLDVDIYSSTRFGLEYFYDRMVSGGNIVIDDFFLKDRFPGVKEAVDEAILKFNMPVVEVTCEGQCVIIKP